MMKIENEKGLLRFILQKNSEIRIQNGREMSYKHPAGRTNKALREKFLSQGIIEGNGSKMILKENIPFETPSSAANFVIGYQVNGLTKWSSDTDEDLKSFLKK